MGRRLTRRCAELKLDSLDAYRAYLEAHPDEWRRLDTFCRITISRFHRDRGIFEAVGARVLPALAEAALARGSAVLQAWSAGCASGEEPYSLRLLWEKGAGQRFSGLTLDVVASDADPHMLDRAARAVYSSSSLREVPEAWHSELTARTRQNGEVLYELAPRLRRRITWRQEDVRTSQPEGPFDLVLCRNLAFTYFDTEPQGTFLRQILERLVTGGALVVGTHEMPPADPRLEPWPGCPRIWRRTK